MDARGRDAGSLFQSALMAGDFGDRIAERRARGGRLARRRLGFDPRTAGRRLGFDASAPGRLVGFHAGAPRGRGLETVLIVFLLEPGESAFQQSFFGCGVVGARPRAAARYVFGPGEARLRPRANGSGAPPVLRRQPEQFGCDRFGVIGLVEVGGINA